MSSSSSSERECFQVSGPREAVLTAEHAEALMRPLMDEKNVSRFRKIKLSDKSFNVEAAKVAATAIERLQGLEVADFSDVIASRPEEEAKKVLEILCNSLRPHSLLELNLSDNALGRRGVAACAGALQGQTRLQKLYFNNNGLEGDAATLIAELVLNNNRPSTLTSFSIRNNLLQDAGANALAPMLAASPSMTELRVASTRFTRVGGLALAKALLNLQNLVSLDLSDNGLGKRAGVELAKVLKQQSNLRFLNLSAIGIDESIAHVASALSHNALLETLDLSDNEMTAADAKQLAKSLPHLPHLKVLLLESNAIKSAGACAVATALRAHKSLTELNLIRNEIKTDAVSELIEAAKDLSLTRLHLNGNMIKVEELNQLRGSFAEEVLGSLSDNEEEYDDYEEEEEEEEEEADEDESVNQLAADLRKQASISKE